MPTLERIYEETLQLTPSERFQLAMRLLNGLPPQSFVDYKTEWSEEEDRARYFARAEAAYEALQNDPQVWKEELAERSLWEKTLMDNQTVQRYGKRTERSRTLLKKSGKVSDLRRGERSIGTPGVEPG